MWKSWQHEKQLRTIAELQLVGQKQLNDSTVARLTSTDAVKDSLGAALAAAHKLNGTLVAALRIRIPARDTMYVHDTLPTTIVDSTRIATFSDSGFAGTITGTVKAPPFPSPLSVTYNVHRPAFAPQVGFVRVANRTVAVVSWQGEQAEIEAPFAEADNRLGTFGSYVEALYGLAGPSLARAGGVIRGPWHFTVVSALEYRIQPGARPELYVGLRKEW
jgi:hypothetical protein